MKPIPLLFKRRDGNGPLTATPTNALAKAVLEGAPGWVPRRELEATASFLLDTDGHWFQYRLLNSRDKRPKLFVETHHSDRKIHGWVPAEQGWAYTALKKALKNREPDEKLPVGFTYALVEDDDGFTLIRHADAEICEPLAGHPLTFKMLDSAFKEVLPRLGWIGVVWWGPNGETYRLGVSDFG